MDINQIKLDNKFKLVEASAGTGKSFTLAHVVLRNVLEKKVMGQDININVSEIKRPGLRAALVGQNIAQQLEKKVNYRRAVKKAIQAMEKIYRKGYKYKKAGVIMLNLSPVSNIRGLLELDKEKSDALMQSFDLINARYGCSTIHTAAEGIEKIWSATRKKTSPCYTTRFNELLKV